MNAFLLTLLILFGPRPAPADDGVALDEILAHADLHAPSNTVARARSERGQASLRAAEVAMVDNPTVNVRVGPRIAGGSVSGTDVRLIVEQPVEIGGQRKRRVDVANREIDRREREVEEARWRTEVSVRAAFRSAQIAELRLQQAEQALRFHERLLEVARTRSKSGETSPIPARLAAGDVARAKVRRIAAERSSLSARFELAERAGWPEGDPLRPVGPLPEVRRAPPIRGLQERAAQDHPSQRRSDAAVAEQTAEVRLAERAGWPRPRFGVQFNREASPVPGSDALIVMGTVALPIPVFARNQGGKARSAAELGVARAERAALQHSTNTRVARAARELDAAASGVEAYEDAILPSLEDDLALLERAYELGELGIVEVSVVQERLMQTQAEALDAYEAYVEAVVELESAVGVDPWNAGRL